MKKIVSSITVWCLLFSCTWAQSSLIEQNATQLAARLTETAETPFISEDLVFQFQDALHAVASSELPAAQLVAKKYRIKSSLQSASNTLDLIIDPACAWLSSLDNANFTQLVNRYNLQVEKVNTEDITTLRIKSETPLNMAYLAKEFSIIEDVLMVELPTETKLKNDIKATVLEHGILLSYTLRNNFYATGTFKSHTWEIMVSNNGTVSLVKEHGDNLTEIDATLALAINK